MGRYNVGYFTGLTAAFLGRYILQATDSIWLFVLITVIVCVAGVSIAQNIKE